MRTFLIILLLKSISSYAQILCPEDEFVVLNYRDTINRIINNQRQGPWLDYKTLLSCDDCQECKSGHAVLKFHVNAMGFYLNDKKNRRWNYYNENKDWIQSSFYTEGILDSLHVYFEKSSKHFVCLFDQGFVSRFIIYFPEGKPKYQARYRSESKDYEIIKYDIDGNSFIKHDDEISSILIAEGVARYISR